MRLNDAAAILQEMALKQDLAAEVALYIDRASLQWILVLALGERLASTSGQLEDMQWRLPHFCAAAVNDFLFPPDVGEQMPLINPETMSEGGWW